MCTNTAGSFRCSCRSGYKLASDGQSCLDIDECRIGFHNCAHTCINNQGSYTCECETGFTLHEDGRSCTFQRKFGRFQALCSSLCDKIKILNFLYPCCRQVMEPEFLIFKSLNMCYLFHPGTIAPPKLTEVFSFCSVVAWRRPPQQCNITITGYDVLFTIPGNFLDEIRRVKNGNQFHYNVRDVDTQNNPEETLVRVKKYNR